MINVLIQYKIKDGVEAEVKEGVSKFISGIRDLEGDGISYTSFQSTDDNSLFRHVGRFKDEDTLKKFQGTAAFKEFSEFLPTKTDGEVTVIKLDQVDTTDINWRA